MKDPDKCKTWRGDDWQCYRPILTGAGVCKDCAADELRAKNDHIERVESLYSDITRHTERRDALKKALGR